MLLNVFTCGDCAGVLKYQTHLRYVGDNSQAFFLTDKARRRIDHGCRNSPSQSCTESVRSAAHLYEGHFFAWHQTDFFQGKSRDGVGGGTETADRHGTAFELLGGFDARLSHQNVVQRSDAGSDKNSVRSREHTVDPSGARDLCDWNVARDQCEDRGGTAGKEYQLNVESVLDEYARFFGNPGWQLIRAGRAIANIQAD